MKALIHGRLRWIIPGAAIALVSIGIFWIVRVARTLDQAADQVRVESQESAIPFQLRPVSITHPGTLDFLPAPPDFRDAQLFHDQLYVCGSGGIWVYDLAGKLQTTYLVGRDLPPSAPVAMAVGSVAGDAHPKLWIATNAAGLLSFDGARFSQIRFDSAGLGNLTSLLMLPTGVLLGGLSEGGVVAYDGVSLKPFHTHLRNLPVTALAGSEGDLWIGTRDRGVVHWSAGSSEEFQSEDGLPDNGVLSLAALGDRIFAGTAVGVAEFRDGKHVRNFADGVFSRALLATAESIFIGTIDEGVIEVRLDAARRFTPHNDLEPRSVVRLTELNGIPFALTADALFERTAGGVWNKRIARPERSLADRNVSALSVDSLGKLWVGYFDRGLDIVADGQTSLHVEDDQVFCVNRIVPDPSRNMQLVATANGLVLFDMQGKVRRRMSQADGLISSHVSDVAAGANGNLALATAAGVTLLDAGGAQSIYAFHGLANNHVYTLALNGPRLLAGTLGGASLIEDGFVRASYTTANSRLKQNWISAIVPFADGWLVGTYGAGILQLDGNGQSSEFPDMPQHTVVNPNAMLTLPNTILAGTLNSGLLIFNTAARRWTPFTEGLPSLNVTALAASSNSVFIGTDNGIVRIPVEDVGR